MSLPTLLDVAKRNASDPAVGLIDEAARLVPEVTGVTQQRGQLVTVANVGAARTIRGTQYKTRVRTALPAAGFRNANEGVNPGKSHYINQLVECFVLNPRWECDVAVATSNEDGAEAYIAEEALATVQAAFRTLGRQFYYGRGTGDAKGHPGLIDSVDTTEMVVDATGSSAGTGSSVWAVSFGMQNVQWVLGQEGALDMTEPRIESIADGSGKRFSAYVQEMIAHVGVQVGHKYAIGRIKNLTAETNKTLTDALLGQLLSRFPIGFRPDAFFMSRRSLEQLRASRTATNVTGAEAPTPIEFENIPIIGTDSILNTEAIG
jgi:hypothetical protein